MSAHNFKYVTIIRKYFIYTHKQKKNKNKKKMIKYNGNNIKIQQLFTILYDNIHNYIDVDKKKLITSFYRPSYTYNDYVKKNV